MILMEDVSLATIRQTQELLAELKTDCCLKCVFLRQSNEPSLGWLPRFLLVFCLDHETPQSLPATCIPLLTSIPHIMMMCTSPLVPSP